MTKNKFNSDFEKIKSLRNALIRAKNKKETREINSDLESYKKKLVRDFDLRSYDFGIESQIYNTDYFIFDVERIMDKIDFQTNPIEGK